MIMPDSFKNENLFPRFVIIRSVDMWFMLYQTQTLQTITNFTP
jgi:hypothetical protein